MSSLIIVRARGSRELRILSGPFFQDSVFGFFLSFIILNFSLVMSDILSLSSSDLVVSEAIYNET